jgi:uncharacterized protein
MFMLINLEIWFVKTGVFARLSLLFARWHNQHHRPIATTKHQTGHALRDFPAFVGHRLGEGSTPMKRPNSHWSDRFRQSLPSRDAMAAHPWLKPVAGRLLDPQLWRLQHESVARGVALGIFWAFVIPVAQMVVAVAHCTWWRANIPVAVAMTMVTNPLTIGFWLWLAYQLGGLILGEHLPATAPQGTTLSAWFAQFGWPTVLGMGIFSVGGAATAYLGVKLVWRLRIVFKRRQRQAGF